MLIGNKDIRYSSSCDSWYDIILGNLTDLAANCLHILCECDFLASSKIVIPFPPWYNDSKRGLERFSITYHLF